MEENTRLYASVEDRAHDSHPPLQSDCGVRRCLKVRRIGSKGVVLVTVWSLLVFSTPVTKMQRGYSIFYGTNANLIIGSNIATIAAIVLVGPIAGLLASIYFGRYKTLCTGLWLMWAGSVFSTLFFIVQWQLSSAARLNESILWFAVLLTADIGYIIGFTLFSVTAVPFGLDQMPDASGDQIKAFIHWYSWSLIAGTVPISLLVNAVFICMDGDIYVDLKFALFCSLLNTALLSATLCSSFVLRGWLTIEPEGRNPLKPFCGILKFAAKHKTPVRRSAFTYWEEDIPSRIDLAKTKYGGPFTNEQVEDVKTCWRMFAVIASIGVTMLGFSACLMSVIVTSALNLNAFNNNTICLSSVSFVGLFACLLYFVVGELLIHPLIERLIQSTLKKVGLSLALPVIGSLLLLVSSALWYLHVACMPTLGGSTPFSVKILIPEIILLYIFVFLLHSSILEFVCAQAPYILRGMVVGLMYSVSLATYVLGAGIYFAWSSVLHEMELSSPSCGVWFYLFTTITATLGCVLWCAVAKWYKRRERDEPDMCRIFAENYYSR